MPELVEQMYCSQQIVIPPKFPYILKRYCKAAIKTQPYDLLRWSYEYFKALSLNTPPPVKLRLEYPVYSTEGGLTRGCLKVLAHQLSGMRNVPLSSAKAAWQGFCLDQNELRRIFCLCEVYLREDSLPFLHLIGVAAGLLTKNLTNTMILFCETLTKEPEGGSAAVPVQDFLAAYRFLASIDASRDVKYLNGYREGQKPEPEETMEEEQSKTPSEPQEDAGSDDFWAESEGLQKLPIINAHVGRSTRLSQRMNEPALGRIVRSPSVERAGQIEWENYQRERKGRASSDKAVDKKLRELSASKFPTQENPKEDVAKVADVTPAKKKEGIDVCVFNEYDQEIPYEIYGEPKIEEIIEEQGTEEIKELAEKYSNLEEEIAEEEKSMNETEKIASYVAECYQAREERREDLEQTFDEIALIVDRFKSANYDLGMVAGRQMSTTSGEFIVQNIEKDIMTFIDDQIAILPDPDLKKKKAKPEEVAMIRDMLETFLDENMEVIAPEAEEIEEEEQPIPEITTVYAVPGIGPAVDSDITAAFEEYALEVSKIQSDLIMPRNIRHFLCPPLEKYEEPAYLEDTAKKIEEVPMGGVMTD